MMTDVAYEILSKRKRAIAFTKLWEEVNKKMAFTPDVASRKIASFYSAMMLDPRFTSLSENRWDLSNRHTFDENHVDTTSIELEDDEELSYDEESEEILEEYSEESTEDEGY